MQHNNLIGGAGSENKNLFYRISENGFERITDLPFVFVAGLCTHYFDDHAMACDVGSDGLDCWIFTETEFERIGNVNSRHHEGKRRHSSQSMAHRQPMSLG